MRISNGKKPSPNDQITNLADEARFGLIGRQQTRSRHNTAT